MRYRMNFNSVKVAVIAAYFILCAVFNPLACATKKPVTTDPALTPEQKWNIAKTGATGAANALAWRITDLEKNPDANAERIRILKIVKGFVDEFNNQVAGVKLPDFSNRETISKAIDRVMDAADNLAAKDVLQLDDPKAQADIQAAIATIKNALETVRSFLPPPQRALNTTDDLLSELKRAVAGLTWTSESDYPFEVFRTDSDIMTGLQAEAYDFDSFFQWSTTEQDWHDAAERRVARRYRSLVRLLKENLTDLKVFKVGEVERDVYVVGMSKSGTAIVLRTKAIET